MKLGSSVRNGRCRWGQSEMRVSSKQNKSGVMDRGPHRGSDRELSPVVECQLIEVGRINFTQTHMLSVSHVLSGSSSAQCLSPACHRCKFKTQSGPSQPNDHRAPFFLPSQTSSLDAQR